VQIGKRHGRVVSRHGGFHREQTLGSAPSAVDRPNSAVLQKVHTAGSDEPTGQAAQRMFKRRAENERSVSHVDLAARIPAARQRRPQAALNGFSLGLCSWCRYIPYDQPKPSSSDAECSADPIHQGSDLRSPARGTAEADPDPLHHALHQCLCTRDNPLSLGAHLPDTRIARRSGRTLHRARGVVVANAPGEAQRGAGCPSATPDDRVDGPLFSRLRELGDDPERLRWTL
jgi:hypothetical protein